MSKMKLKTEGAIVFYCVVTGSYDNGDETIDFFFSDKAAAERQARRLAKGLGFELMSRGMDPGLELSRADGSYIEVRRFFSDDGQSSEGGHISREDRHMHH